MSRMTIKHARLLLYTVQYLQFRQICFQFWFRIRRRLRIYPKPSNKGTIAIRRHCEKKWCRSITKTTSYLGKSSFLFLNQTRECIDASSWNRGDFGKLWLYNLHYFDYLGQLVPPGKEWVERWIAENPPMIGNGWEPYPTSLRIVNWIKWHFQTHQLKESQLQSLNLQAQWLSDNVEYHILGNHLWANAKALVFAGLFFKSEKANRWLRKGGEILRRELKIQILSDGGHFERSPMYHAIITEDVLDLINLFNIVNGCNNIKDLDFDLRITAGRMIDWLQAMLHPDGKISFFNDSSLGISPCIKDLMVYARQLGIEVGNYGTLESPTVFLRKSGFVRFKHGPFVLIADVGTISPSYQPGHSHAEALSFELSVWKNRCLVNSGTSTYEPGVDRCYQRSSEAHNCLVADGMDSSEVWSSHRVARRAKVSVESFDISSLSAAHNGFCRNCNLGTHKRTWEIMQNGIKIIDKLEGRGHHQIEVFFHIHPNWFINLENQYQIILSLPGLENYLRVNLSGLNVDVRESSYYPEFGKVMQNYTIRAHGWVDLPYEFVTKLEIL